MASTLNPDNLRNNMRIAITNHLNDALEALPGRWPVGRRRSLLFSHRKQVAESLMDSIWPLVTQAALEIAQVCIDDPGACKPAADAERDETAALGGFAQHLDADDGDD